MERELASGRPAIALTVGDSMEPLLYNQSTRVVIVRPERELRPGDLPLYRRPSGQFVIHRIIKMDETYYYTRGDNRIGLEPVPKEWVQGVVTEIYRRKRHFQVTDWRYRLYVRCWNAIYPIRWGVYLIRVKVWKRWNRKRRCIFSAKRPCE